MPLVQPTGISCDICLDDDNGDAADDDVDGVVVKYWGNQAAIKAPTSTTHLLL